MVVVGQSPGTYPGSPGRWLLHSLPPSPLHLINSSTSSGWQWSLVVGRSVIGCPGTLASGGLASPSLPWRLWGLSPASNRTLLASPLVLAHAMLLPFELCPFTNRSSSYNLGGVRYGGIGLVDLLLGDVMSTLAQVMVGSWLVLDLSM